MSEIRFCPICGDIMQLVKRTIGGVVYWHIESPECGYSEVTDPPAEGVQADKVVNEEVE